MKCQDDKRACWTSSKLALSWWKGKLMKRQVDERQVDEKASWWKDKLMKRQGDKLTSLYNRHVDEMVRWQNEKRGNGKLTKEHVDETTNWQKANR